MSLNRIIGAVAVAMALMTSGIVHAANYKPLDGDPKELNFGFISTESSQNLKNQWEPLLADLAKALKMPVKSFFASDYAGIIEGMRFGKVQTAWLGNKSAMEAVDRANAEVFAQQVNSDGTQGYYSYVLVSKENTKLNSLTDLLKCDKSLNFGIGDPNSTSGYLVPSFYVFAQNKADPKTCFKTVRTANHETNLAAVANKQVDAATNNSEQLGRTMANLPELAAKVKVIWTSPLIPSDPMVYRRDLSNEMKARIKGFFLTYGRLGNDAEREKKVLAGISAGLAPFVDSGNYQLYPVRELELFKDRLKFESDDRMDKNEKARKIADIDSQLMELKVLTKAIM